MSLVALLCESDPMSAPPGIRRRFEHISKWLESQGIDFNVHVVGTKENPGGHVARIRAVRAAESRIARDMLEYDAVVVLGLGAVHMQWLASRLARRGVSVVFDSCDSWIGQLTARLSTSRKLLAIPSVCGVILQWMSTRRFAVSYISQGDLARDNCLNRKRYAGVIPPNAPRSLATLPRMQQGKLSRVVIAADFDSFHVKSGVASIVAVWPEFHNSHPHIRLELYGVGKRPSLLRGFVDRGYAPSLADVYAGNTLVFVPNAAGSGIPNKVVEGVIARRPLLMHESMARHVVPHSWISTYTSPTTLLDALRESASREYGEAVEIMELKPQEREFDLMSFILDARIRRTI